MFLSFLLLVWGGLIFSNRSAICSQELIFSNDKVSNDKEVDGGHVQTVNQKKLASMGAKSFHMAGED
jgi:hypothetical protein